MAPPKELPKPSKHFSIIRHRFGIETSKDVEEVIVTFIVGSIKERDSHYFTWFQGLTQKAQVAFDNAMMSQTSHKTFIEGNSLVTTVFNGYDGLLIKDFIRKDNRTQVTICGAEGWVLSREIPDRFSQGAYRSTNFYAVL